jgi:signal transduction protein with GAF and PtsI domain
MMKIEADIGELIQLVGTAIETYTTAFFLSDNQKQVLNLCRFHSLSDNIIEGVAIPFGYGPIGWVAENQKPFDLTKFSDRDSGLLKLYSKNEQVKSFAAVPVLKEDLLLGVLCVDSKTAFDFTVKEQKLLIMFSDLFADFVNNIMLRDFINVDISGIDLLYNFCQSTVSFDKVENILQLALDSILEILKCDDCFICFRTTEEKPYFRIEAVSYHESLKNSIFSEQDGLAGCVISSKEPCLLKNRGNDFGAKLFRSANNVRRFSSFLGIPLLIQGKVFGLICAIDSRKNYFNQRDLYLVSIMGNNMANAIFNIRVQEKANKLSKLIISKEPPDNSNHIGPNRP